jgi:hypothetical protein
MTRRVCGTCGGDGGMVQRAPFCHHTNGNCPCEHEWVRCPDCIDGVPLCEECRTLPAVTTVGDENLCDLCAAERSMAA